MTDLEKGIALAARLAAISQEVTARHIQRGDVVQATWLALLTGRPAFFLGSPGVDKTGTVQDLAKRILGAVFYDALIPTVVSAEQLLVESTSILEQPAAGGGKEIRTHDTLGRAAAAHILFADEIWKGEPRVLQALIDLAKGDGVRHEGALVKTPLKAFVAASNELPDPDGNLGAVWSRMTLRVQVNPLDRAGKEQLVRSRLAGTRAAAETKAAEPSAQLTLADIETLRAARRLVTVPEEMIGWVLDILQELTESTSQDFTWAWADDRRFGRIFDVLQAQALLNGRGSVSKQDLVVLEWLLWDTPEQIPAVQAVLARYCRTPLTDAQELLDSLLATGGTVQTVLGGNRGKGVEALTQCESTVAELTRLHGQASDEPMKTAIAALQTQLAEVKGRVIAVVTGAPMPQGG